MPFDSCELWHLHKSYISKAYLSPDRLLGEVTQPSKQSVKRDYLNPGDVMVNKVMKQPGVYILNQYLP